MTEGNGHVIDPGGDAHRALQAAVAEHGPDVLSDAAIMDGICRERLGALPSEATLIGTAARSDVPALLQEQISQLGNYGGIQSVASTLAATHGLDRAESLWVVREYARALGLIAGGTRATRRTSGSAGAGDAEAGAAGAAAAGAAAAAAGAAAAGGADTGGASAEASGAGADTALNRAAERQDDPGDTVLNRAVERHDDPGDTALNQTPWAASGFDEASPNDTVLGEAAGSQAGPGDTELNRAVERHDDPGDTALNQTPWAASGFDEASPNDTVLGEAAGSQAGPGDTELNRAAERHDDPGDTALNQTPWAASGFDEASPNDTVLGEAAGSPPGPGDTALNRTASSEVVTPSETALDEAVTDEGWHSEDRPGDTVLDKIADDDQSGPGDTAISPVGGGQAPAGEVPPVEAPPFEVPHSATVFSEAAGGVAATAAEGVQAPESEAPPDPVWPAVGADDRGGDEEPSWAGANSGTNEAGEDAWPPAEEGPVSNWGGTWEPVADDAAFGGYQQGPPPAEPARGGGPGYPPESPGGDGYPPQQPLPYAVPKSNRNRNRNILGIAAAIALVAVYLGIAAVAHLTPFQAKTTAATSTPPPSQTSSTSSSPSASSTASATATPTQPADVLLAKIPADIAGTNNCKNIGAASGATARLQCTGFSGPATGIIYYLYSDPSALSKGFDSFLASAKFKASTKSCTVNGKFVSFVVQCEDMFSNQAPAAAGRIAEYQRVNDFDPIIASTDTPQLVMAVLVGTNNDSLLSYWKQFGWIKS